MKKEEAKAWYLITGTEEPPKEWPFEEFTMQDAWIVFQRLKSLGYNHTMFPKELINQMCVSQARGEFDKQWSFGTGLDVFPNQ